MSMLPKSISAVIVTACKYLFILLPALLSFFFLHRYALNIPSQDDYDAILGFLVSWKNSPGPDRFLLLFQQQNEHRLLWSHIIYVLYDGIMGGINFRSLIFLANLQLLAAVFLLVAFIRRALPRYWVVASFITGLCVFDLNNWENASFAMAGMQTYGLLLLLVAAMFLYSREGIAFLLTAALVQVVCTYSSGNGIIASAFLVMYTVLLRTTGSLPGRVASTRVIISALVFVVCSPLYFLHYQSIPHGDLLPAPRMITWFFRFAGQHIYIDSYALSVFAGLAVCCALVLVLPVSRRLRMHASSAPFICLAGFVLATMATAAIFRSAMGNYIPSRYLLYPHLLMALLFIALMIKLQAHKMAVPVAIAYTALMLIAYNMNSRGGIKDMEQLHTTLKTVDYYYPHPLLARRTANAACQLKIYCRANQH